MVHHVIQFLAFVAAVMVTARIVPGVRVKSFGGALVFSLVFALFNKLLFTPLAVISLPLVLLTFGLFLVVINAFLFWLADKVVKGIEISGFGAALVASIVTSIVNWAITWVLRFVF